MKNMIDIKEKLPPKEGNYVVYTDKGKIDFAYFTSDKKWIMCDENISYWKELPLPPKSNSVDKENFIGTILYTNIAPPRAYYRKSKRPYKVKVCFIGINGIDDFFNVVYEDNINSWQFKFSDLEKEIFFSKQKAMNKLMGVENL